MRERGLKLDALEQAEARAESLPVRERGLKQRCCLRGSGRGPSLPVRERGLKPNGWNICSINEVAPRAGAWIEALLNTRFSTDLLSLPVRERGLKPAT